MAHEAVNKAEDAASFFGCRIFEECKEANAQIKRAHRNRIMAALLHGLLQQTDKMKRRRIAQGCLQDVQKRGLQLPGVLLATAGQAVRMALLTH